MMVLNFSTAADGDSTDRSRGTHDLVLVVEEEESFLVESAVGVVVEGPLLGAVHVVPPITDQSNLVEERHVRAEVAGRIAVNVAAVKHLAAADIDVGVEAGLFEFGAVDVVLRNLGQNGEVSAGNHAEVQLLDLFDGKIFAAQFGQCVPNLRLLIAVGSAFVNGAGTGQAHKDSDENEALHGSGEDELI